LPLLYWPKLVPDTATDPIFSGGMNQGLSTSALFHVFECDFDSRLETVLDSQPRAPPASFRLSPSSPAQDWEFTLAQSSIFVSLAAYTTQWPLASFPLQCFFFHSHIPSPPYLFDPFPRISQFLSSGGVSSLPKLHFGVSCLPCFSCLLRTILSTFCPFRAPLDSSFSSPF